MTSAFPVILAFGFASPWLLGGLALAGIPIAIHLLHKRRYVEVHWAAMRFLMEATRRQSRRMRMQNLILLLLRTLIVALLVIALARPHFESSGSVLQSEQPVHRIVVLDASFSMQFTETGGDPWDVDQAGSVGPRTRFARAIDAIRALVEHSRRGDAWNLVLITDAEPFAVISRPAFGTDALLEELGSLAAGDSPGDLAGALRTAQQLTAAVPEIPRKEVIVVTDMQSSMWTPENADTKRELAAVAKLVAEKARLSIVNVSGAGSSNAAVTALQMDSSSVTVGNEVGLRSTIRNFGATALREQVVELLLDGRLIDTRRVDLPSGSDVPVDWTHTFRTPGEFRLEVHLQDDALPLDNRRWLPLAVHEQFDVLIVDGRPAGRPRETASYYVQRALAPVTADDRSPGLFRTQVIGDGELLSINPARYDAIVLCNVSLLTDREAALLDTFVRSGGGLLVLPGDQTSADNLNQQLYRDGEGILPARLGEHITAPDENSVFTFDPRGFAHPVVRAFRGNPGAGLETTMTLQFIRLEPDARSSTALWFNEGSPAIVSAVAGSGRVVLAATSADERWGTWAVWAPSFVPIINEAVLYAVSGRWGQRQLAVGESITATWPARLFDMPVSVTLPDDSTQPVPLQERDDIVAATFEDTRQAGVYQLRLGAPLNRTDVYAANVDTRESDLLPAARTDLQSGAFTGIELAIRTGDDPTSPTNAPQYDTGLSMISRGLAWMVLAALLIEPLLAWRFSAGMAALSLAAVAGLLIPVAGLTGSICISVVAAALLTWRWKQLPG